MRRRAEQVDQTRQRIVEATVALHGSVGPAATTIAAIAEKAGVTRLPGCAPAWPTCTGSTGPAPTC